MTLHRRLASIYAGIGRTYFSKGRSLLLLAAAVFLPLSLLEALVTAVEIDSIDLESGLQVFTILLATVAITVTGLLGEVFYSGAVAVSLTHPKGQRPPSILEVAKRLDYRRLILVDIVYVAMVIVGLLIFFVPGILVFVWFGLSGPIVELEGRKVGSALRRSVDLVRGNFWLVFFVLAPVELAGDLVGELAEHGVHDLLGESFFSTWMGATASNLIFTPIFAIAAVLLTLDLIERRAAAAGSPAPLATPSR